MVLEVVDEEDEDELVELSGSVEVVVEPSSVVEVDVTVDEVEDDVEDVVEPSVVAVVDDDGAVVDVGSGVDDGGAVVVEGAVVVGASVVVVGASVVVVGASVVVVEGVVVVDASVVVGSELLDVVPTPPPPAPEVDAAPPEVRRRAASSDVDVERAGETSGAPAAPETSPAATSPAVASVVVICSPPGAKTTKPVTTAAKPIAANTPCLIGRSRVSDCAPSMGRRRALVSGGCTSWRGAPDSGGSSSGSINTEWTTPGTVTSGCRVLFASFDVGRMNTTSSPQTHRPATTGNEHSHP